MLYPELYETTTRPKNKLEKNLYSCDARPDAYVVAYVSKMFAIPESEMPERKKRERERLYPLSELEKIKSSLDWYSR